MKDAFDLLAREMFPVTVHAGEADGVESIRGALIDGTALREALAGGRLGGFAADVLDGEPPATDDPLLARDDVVLTPHVASLTSATYRRLCVSTAENVARVLRGEPVDPRALFGQRV
jgi:phosphoglycerate dehydrogenase-like enzyme